MKPEPDGFLAGGSLALARNAATGLAHRLVAGIGEIVVTRDPEVELATYSLGSCLGLVAVDATRGVVGLAHCMLPLSTEGTSSPESRPAMYVDLGLRRLFESIAAIGARRESTTLKLAGAANPMDPTGRFKVGERNVEVARAIARKLGLAIESEDVGGVQPRTVITDLSSCRVERGREEVFL